MSNATETQVTFVVTACPDHGTKEVSDFASFRVYVDAARDCEHEVHFDQAHTGDHIGESCWVCCPRMVTDPHGILDH